MARPDIPLAHVVPYPHPLLVWQRQLKANQAPVAFFPDGAQVVVGCAEPEVFPFHG